jgi:hypothetical protein
LDFGIARRLFSYHFDRNNADFALNLLCALPRALERFMRKQPSPIAIRPAPGLLPRTPLVPDDLLRRSNVYFAIDTRFRAAARYLQALWLKDHDIETGLHISKRADTITSMELGSILSAEAARAGKNFISPMVHNLVRHALIMREEGAAIDEHRLFANALSSMPMTFNVFAPLALDLGLASTVLRRLLPDFVHSVEGFRFEHSPGRREERFLHDGTAFDLAIDITTPDGEIGTIFLEMKYSEDMSGPAARLRDRYDEASREVRLYRDPNSVMLRSLALEQLWREHMLAQLTVDQGITPRALFLLVSPRLNRRVQAAVRLYRNELIDVDDRDDNRVGFEAITLETVIDAIGEAGASDISKVLWARYCDFERVFEASIQEFVEASTADDDVPSQPAAILPVVHDDADSSQRRPLRPLRRPLRPLRRLAGPANKPKRARRNAATASKEVVS